jgi:hypothetical protein
VLHFKMPFCVQPSWAAPLLPRLVHACTMYIFIYILAGARLPAPCLSRLFRLCSVPFHYLAPAYEMLLTFHCLLCCSPHHIPAMIQRHLVLTRSVSPPSLRMLSV